MADEGQGIDRSNGNDFIRGDARKGIYYACIYLHVLLLRHHVKPGALIYSIEHSLGVIAKSFLTLDWLWYFVLILFASLLLIVMHFVYHIPSFHQLRRSMTCTKLRKGQKKIDVSRILNFLKITWCCGFLFPGALEYNLRLNLWSIKIKGRLTKHKIRISFFQFPELYLGRK